MKCFSATIRKVRSRPFSRSASSSQRFSSRQPEELLGEVLRIMRRLAAAPDVGVERIPVGAADGLQRRGGLRRGRCLAASTTDQRVGGKAPGCALELVWSPMRIPFHGRLPKYVPLLQSALLLFLSSPHQLVAELHARGFSVICSAHAQLRNTSEATVSVAVVIMPALPKVVWRDSQASTKAGISQARKAA